jgi:predicted transcriptional regulator
MTTVTLRIPDDTCLRLKQLASSRGASLNKLMEELGTAAVVAHDSEIRLKAAGARANSAAALAVLGRLDRQDAQ